MELSEGGEMAVAGVAQQRFGEVSAGLLPTPASTNRECSSLPGLSGLGSNELTEELKRVLDQPSCQGRRKESPGALGTCSQVLPRNSLALQGSSPGSERCGPKGPSAPKCTQLSNKLLISMSKARPGFQFYPRAPRQA